VNESTRQARRRFSSLQEELDALPKLPLGELASRYEKLFGVPTKTHNKPYLLKKVRWRMQELEHGGLSDEAKRRVEELGAPEPENWRWRNRPADDDSESAKASVETAAAVDEPHPADIQRDPRLPPAGTVLRRAFKRKTYEVLVLDDGFALDGEHFNTLSAVASHIAGSSWNGFRFFGLTAQGPGNSRARGAA